MPSPLVSVLTTSYNRAEYIASTIESVLHQSFADFEYLIVDDCSKDSSLQVARRYETDTRVRVFENEKNLGDYGNRNKAVRLARGKYIKFVDCDDITYPHCLARMIEDLERFPEAGVAFSSRERPPWRYPVLLSPEQVYRLHFAEGGVLHQGALSALIRKDALLAVGCFPEIYTGDVACWLKMARRYPAVLTTGGLFWWRKHCGQLSQSLRTVTRQWGTHHAEGARLHWEALMHPNCPLPNAERQYYKSRLVREYQALLFRSILCGRISVAAELLRGCSFGWPDTISALLPSGSPKAFPPPRVDCVPCGQIPCTPPTSFRSLAPWVTSAASPPISVLMPLYNEEAVVADAIESVIAQDLADWELIMIDDASTDGTAAIVRSYSDGRRIRFHQNCIHLGKWANHNRCVEYAAGDYLKFLHADDALYPQALGVFLWYAKRFPDAALVLSCSDERHRLPRLLSPCQTYLAEYCGLLSLGESPSGLLYQKDAWESSGGLDSDCASAPFKLHLEIVRSGSALLIPGGLVSYTRGSQQLRRRRQRGFAWSNDELPWLGSLLNHEQCPLDVSQRRAAFENLSRAETLLAWKRRIGDRNPVSRAILNRLPQPFDSGVGRDLDLMTNAAFDRALYPPPFAPMTKGDWHG